MLAVTAFRPLRMEQSRQHERKSTEPSGARERIALTIAAPLVSSRRPSAAAPGAIAWATFRRLGLASAINTGSQPASMNPASAGTGTKEVRASRQRRGQVKS